MRNPTDSAPESRGRRLVYGPEVFPLLKAIWFLMEQPCAKNLKVLLPVILPAFIKRQPVESVLQTKLLQMSAASIDRRLKEIRVQQGLCTTKAPTPSWYKSAIPVVPKDWNIT